MRRRWPRCGPCGKCRYPSQPAAEQMAAFQMHNWPAFLLSVYRCPSGNGWHITKAPQLRRNGRR